MEQMGLFDHFNFNTMHRLKAALREAAKSSGLSRETIAERMTAIMKTDGLALPGNSRSVSITTLDKWLADRASHMIPVCLLPVFCQITRSNLPFIILTQPLDMTVIKKDQTKVLEWGMAEINKRKSAKQARKLAEEIGL